MLGRSTAVVAALVMLAACSQGQDTAQPESAQRDRSTSATTGTIAAVAAPVTAAGATAPKGAKSASKVTLRVLPQISQAGKKVSSAASARTAVEVAVSPKRRTVVTLQVHAGKKWKKVATAATGTNGRYVFSANAKYSNKAATYRAVVGKRASASASTAQWLRSTFTDDFSGSRLSQSWGHQRAGYNPGGMRACSRGSAKAVAVQSGTVKLSVLKDKSRGSKCSAKRNGKSVGKYSYRLNGNISTQNRFSFKYGFAAARMKFPRAGGQHGSFWMMPQVHVSGTVNPKLTGAEIDVVESFGEKYGKGRQGMTSFTYHWDYDRTRTRGVKTKTGGWLKNPKSFLDKKGEDWWNAYHVFSVEWTPTQYIFRIDGKESWRSSRGVSGQPQYLALSLLSSDYEIPLLKGGDKALPQTMDVDWVRVWETGR
jgi:beta-glucanase (GH16 family)